MPTPTLTHTISSDNALDVTSLTTMAQDYAYRVHLAMKAAGWTCYLSSDGTANAGASDYLSSASAFDLAAAGSGWWACYSSPAGFCAGSTVHVLLGADDASSPYTQVEIRMATSAYSGGSISALPTTAGTEITMGAAGDDWVPYTTNAVDARYHTDVTSKGDVLVALRTASGSYLVSLFMLVGHTDTYGVGEGNYRCAIFNYAATTGVSYSHLSSSSYWLAFNSAGTTSTTARSSSNIWVATSWTSGASEAGTISYFPIAVLSTAAAGRDIGTLVDWYGTSPALTPGQTLDEESAQSQRLLSVGNGILILANDADLPWS